MPAASCPNPQRIFHISHNNTMASPISRDTRGLLTPHQQSQLAQLYACLGDGSQLVLTESEEEEETPNIGDEGPERISPPYAPEQSRPSRQSRHSRDISMAEIGLSQKSRSDKKAGTKVKDADKLAGDAAEPPSMLKDPPPPPQSTRDNDQEDGEHSFKKSKKIVRHHVKEMFKQDLIARLQADAKKSRVPTPKVSRRREKDTFPNTKGGKTTKSKKKRKKDTMKSPPKKQPPNDLPAGDQSPKEQSPKEQSPKEQSPKEQSPKEQSPKEQPPKEQPPKEQPPKEQPPKEQSPNEESPKEQSPKEKPPNKESPNEESPKEQPPKEQSPKEQPPKEESPKEQPPKEESPKEQPPNSAPAADRSKPPVILQEALPVAEETETQETSTAANGKDTKELEPQSNTGEDEPMEQIHTL